MKALVLDQRALSAIVEALRLQIAGMDEQLAALGDSEMRDDFRSELNNDIGFLRALAGDVERAASEDLRDMT